MPTLSELATKFPCCVTGNAWRLIKLIYRKCVWHDGGKLIVKRPLAWTIKDFATALGWAESQASAALTELLHAGALPHAEGEEPAGGAIEREPDPDHPTRSVWWPNFDGMKRAQPRSPRHVVQPPRPRRQQVSHDALEITESAFQFRSPTQIAALRSGEHQAIANRPTPPVTGTGKRGDHQLEFTGPTMSGQAALRPPFSEDQANPEPADSLVAAGRKGGDHQMEFTRNQNSAMSAPAQPPSANTEDPATANTCATPVTGDPKGGDPRLEFTGHEVIARCEKCGVWATFREMKTTAPAVVETDSRAGPRAESKFNAADSVPPERSHPNQDGGLKVDPLYIFLLRWCGLFGTAPAPSLVHKVRDAMQGCSLDILELRFRKAESRIRAANSPGILVTIARDAGDYWMAHQEAHELAEGQRLVEVTEQPEASEQDEAAQVAQRQELERRAVEMSNIERDKQREARVEYWRAEVAQMQPHEAKFYLTTDRRFKEIDILRAMIHERWPDGI